MNSGFGIVDKIVDVVINPLIMLLFALATFFFMWGLLVFIARPENTEAKRTGVNHMIWGMAGMLIIVTVYGIITLIMNTLGVDLPKMPR